MDNNYRLRIIHGQRPRAYLMSFNEKIRRAFILCRNQTQADMLLYRTVDTPEHMDMLQADVDRVSA